MALLPLFPDHDIAAALPTGDVDSAATAPSAAAAPISTATTANMQAGAAHCEPAKSAPETIAVAPDAAPIACIEPAVRPADALVPGQAATVPAPICAARAAMLPQLRSAPEIAALLRLAARESEATRDGPSFPAHLWRADEIAHAADLDATIASGFAALDAELPGGGWPQGQLIELLLDAPGIGELSLLAPALAQHTQDACACVWVLPCERAAKSTLPALPYPPALATAGVDLARALFVQPETPREAFWAIEQSLRAAHLGALLGWLPHTSSREGEFRALRRLQLLASRQRALVFLLREARAR